LRALNAFILFSLSEQIRQLYIFLLFLYSRCMPIHSVFSLFFSLIHNSIKQIRSVKQIRLRTSRYTVCNYRIISDQHLAGELCKLYLHFLNHWQFFRQLLWQYPEEVLQVVSDSVVYIQITNFGTFVWKFLFPQLKKEYYFHRKISRHLYLIQFFGIRRDSDFNITKLFILKRLSFLFFLKEFHLFLHYYRSIHRFLLHKLMYSIYDIFSVCSNSFNLRRYCIFTVLTNCFSIFIYWNFILGAWFSSTSEHDLWFWIYITKHVLIEK